MNRWLNFFYRSDILLVLIVVNAIGTIWGFLWYREQLWATPWQYWPLTPDCPLISLCFMIFLTWIRGRQAEKSSWASLIAWIAVLGSFKYGVWTVLVLAQYFLSAGSQPDWQDWMLMVSHLGLLAQGMLFQRNLPKLPLMYGGAMVWFLLNDYADWLLGFHPRLPMPDEFAFAMWLSILLTIGAYFWGRSILKSAPIKQ